MKDSRRKFLKGLVGISGLGFLGFSKLGVANAKERNTYEVPKLPWKYVELDPEYVRKLGHFGYYMFECGGTAFWSIMTALREKVGYPYTLVPIPSKEEIVDAIYAGRRLQVPMQFGVGGGVGWGSLCGTTNGAASVITMVMKMREAKNIIRRLFRYYEESLFPTDISNKYAAQHKFFVPVYKSDKPIPRSVSGSVLCHTSVAKWCLASGFPSNSRERSERCARLAGDIAAMAVELLNANLKGNLNTVSPFKFSHDTASCRTCHYKGKKYEAGQFERGMMACETCHRDIRPHLTENKLRTAFGVEVGKWAGAVGVGTVAGLGSHMVARGIMRKGKSDEE